MTRELDRAAALVDAVADVHEHAPVPATERSLTDIASDVGGRAAAASAAASAGNEVGASLMALQLVGRCGLITLDHVAEMVFRREGEDLLAARPRAAAALHRLVLAGYLDKRTVAYELTEDTDVAGAVTAVGRLAFAKAFTLTSKASTDYALPPSPTFPESFIIHHFQTLEAAWRVERDYRLRGFEIVGFALESELIRRDFASRRFSRGVQRPGLYPDARLLVRAPGAPLDAEPEAVNVEYVSRSYSDEMIRAKQAGFGGARTVWAVPGDSPGTADRVASITGREPMSL